MAQTMKLAVVLMSGGMDSATTVAVAKSVGYKVAALHVTYGQRTQQRELKAFNDLCDYFQIENRLVVPIDYLKAIGGSSLTDARLQVEKAELERKEIPSTYVPFRMVICFQLQQVGQKSLAPPLYLLEPHNKIPAAIPIVVSISSLPSKMLSIWALNPKLKLVSKHP